MKISNRRFKPSPSPAAPPASRPPQRRTAHLRLLQLELAPIRMACRGVKLWAYAELDMLRLTLKRCFLGQGKNEEMPARFGSDA